MQIVISAATRGEWEQAATFFSNQLQEGYSIGFHEAGVGVLSTTYSLTQIIQLEKPDYIIQAGIAGAFEGVPSLGEVVIVEDDRLGDLGVMESTGWKTTADLGFANDADLKLVNPYTDRLNFLQLPKVHAVTVNQITTSEQQARMYTNKFSAQIETMEGAALHYVCKQLSIPFIQIRAISNKVGERDKSKWLLAESIRNLNETLQKYVPLLLQMKN
jgi:futalosine hydrolase